MSNNHAEALVCQQAQSATEVVIGDGHPLSLEGLSHVLNAMPGIQVVHRCSRGDELLSAVQTHTPELVILDVRLPGLDGLAVLSEIRARGLQVTAILTGEVLREEELLEVVRLGIRGLIPKDAPIETFRESVRTVLAGGTCLDQSVIGRAMAAFLTREAFLRELASSLTAREVQVLKMIVAGLKTREVADRLFVSEGTLKVHLHHIYKKLSVTSRGELIDYSRKRGLV